MTTTATPARTERDAALRTALAGFRDALPVDEAAQLRARFPRLSADNALLVALQRPDATEVHSWWGWRTLGRRVRHGEHGTPLLSAPGKPIRHVWDVTQTEPDAQPLTPTVPEPAGETEWESLLTNANAGQLLQLATCSYTEFRAGMGVPVRFTAGYPRFLKLDYKIAGWARLISPAKEMLSLPRDAYTLTYRRNCDAAGVDRIRAELAAYAQPGQPVVLLCFERLADEKKPGQWCHRTMFAQWWQEQTGEVVPELGAVPHSHSTAGPTGEASNTVLF